MAVRADFDLQRLAERRTGLERVPTAAGYVDQFVVRMNSALHGRGLRQVIKMGREV
jgi:hypothetical protein